MSAATYDTLSETSENSMFGTPIYARTSKRESPNKKVLIGAGVAGLAVAAGALLWATRAAQDTSQTAAMVPTQVASAPMAQPVASTPAPVRELTPAPVATLTATPARTLPARAAPTPQARVAVAAPSATDSASDVSAREYAPVLAQPAPASERAAPAITEQPPQAAPIPLIAE